MDVISELYLATLNTLQVVLLAWIGSEAAAQRRERKLAGGTKRRVR